MHAFVDTLLTRDSTPTLTVTASLDRRQPAGHEDRIRFRNLVTEARSRLAELPDRPVAERIRERLDDAVADVDLGGGALGIVVVATTDHAEVRSLPFPVRDAVSIAATPATRYLVQGLRRSPRYRVLVVSDRATRLFEGVRDRLVEIIDEDFPTSARIAPSDRRAFAGPFALARGRDDKERRRQFYRDVDRALTEAGRGDPLPVILVGVRRSTRLFRETSDNDQLIVGHVDGAYDKASPGMLGAIVWELMRDELRKRRTAAVDELSAAMSAGRAVTGLDEVWQFGREGRGRLLVVEEDYIPAVAREHEGRLVAPDDERALIEDPVDEIVEHVLRTGGAVEFVANGALAQLGHIGLILR